MDISLRTGEGRFNYRVAGLLIDKSRLLIMTDEQSQHYFIPGGRVLINELSEDAIIREIREELNIEVKVNRMLWVSEEFFHEDYYNEQFHEICFYYLLDLVDKKLMSKGNKFLIEEGKHSNTFMWVEIENISELDLRPDFVKNNISKLPREIKHMVSKH